jgi:hydroxyacylglutathione hydrolase
MTMSRGGYQLARELDATYVDPTQSRITFKATELADSEIIEIGSLRITGYHTPGHTEHHMSYKIAGLAKKAIG